MQWLDLFCQTLSCTDYFKQQVGAQLGEQFTQQTGMSLEGFVLVPPPEGAAGIRFDQQGVSYLDTDLVGPDAYGYPVGVAWFSPDRQRVVPSDAGPQSGDTTIQAWWYSLPVDELKNSRASSDKTPWPVSADFPFDPANYSFEVIWQPFAWPDAWLEVQTAHPAFPRSSGILTDALAGAREQWNQAAAAGAGKGIIHNLGTQQKVISPVALAINVDFGSAAPLALLKMLDAIEKVVDVLAVHRVVCRSFEVDKA